MGNRDSNSIPQTNNLKIYKKLIEQYQNDINDIISAGGPSNIQKQHKRQNNCITFIFLHVSKRNKLYF